MSSRFLCFPPVPCDSSVPQGEPAEEDTAGPVPRTTAPRRQGIRGPNSFTKAWVQLALTGQRRKSLPPPCGICRSTLPLQRQRDVGKWELPSSLFSVCR